MLDFMGFTKDILLEVNDILFDNNLLKPIFNKERGVCAAKKERIYNTLETEKPNITL